VNQHARHWEVRRRALWVAAGATWQPPSTTSEALVGLPVQLFVQGLGVERIGWGRNAGENRKCNQRGYDGLHGYFSKNAGNTIVAGH